MVAGDRGSSGQRLLKQPRWGSQWKKRIGVAWAGVIVAVGWAVSLWVGVANGVGVDVAVAVGFPKSQAADARRRLTSTTRSKGNLRLLTIVRPEHSKVPIVNYAVSIEIYPRIKGKIAFLHPISSAEHGKVPKVY